MKPVVVLVGRPNVGKSTLFNRLAGGRDALVADVPGLTRDRQYATGTLGDRPYLVVDTGGLAGWSSSIAVGGPPDTLETVMTAQVRQAIEEADAIIFLTDGREGVNTEDCEIAEALRKRSAPTWLAVNKTEGMDPSLVTAEFHALGAGEPFAISASHGDGVAALMARVLQGLPRVEEGDHLSDMPTIAVAGRPNVGKSTLINALLGEDRVVVFEEPGTTRDSIHVALERNGRYYVLIDTAGVRRRAKIGGTVEKYSVVKTLKAIEAANVVILVLDARAGISEQDAMLAGFILECGRAIVLAVNKWDGLEEVRCNQVKRELDRKLHFLSFARTHFISAREGIGLAGLFASVDRAFASARKTLRTPELNRVVQNAVRATSPPRGRGGPVRLKFAHQGGRNPPLVVIHGTRVDAVPLSYRRYLSNAVRAGFDLEGTPIQIELRAGQNPFERAGGRHMEKGRETGKKRKKRVRAAGRVSTVK